MDRAGNTATATRSISVKKEISNTSGLYYGMDIKSGEFKNGSDGDVTYSGYDVKGNYKFVQDDELNQTVLSGPDTGNLVIDGLNLEPLDNQFTIETYIKIPSTISSYDVFQFDGQNINLVGFLDNTYFGAGRYSSGDADVYVEQNLPTDQWLHIICTAKEGEQELYVNGVEFASNDYEELNITSTNDDELILGSTYSGRSGLIQLAYFRIYSGFVSAAQAETMYDEMQNGFSADYAAVDAAIAEIPSDLSVFTEDSVTALNTTVNAVDRSKNITEQSTVDGYADAIESAVRALNNPDLYFGIDIANWNLENEIGSDVTDSTYLITGDTGGYEFETDDELNQTVLCRPEKENLVIDDLNLASLDHEFTVEAYLKIPSQLSASGDLTAYDVFQFDGQNINLVGGPDGTYFGAGGYTDGDADVFTGKELPTDQWIHVLCTAKDGVQTLYVNGEEFASGTYAGLNIASRGNDELVLGGITAERSGRIKFASFRVYKGFRDAEQAESMYNNMKNRLVSHTAPKAKCPVPEQTVKVGDITELSASDIAEDADGDPLTITAIATAPDSAIATASLDKINGTVTMTGAAEGSTSVTLTVSDGTDTVNVTVPITISAGTVADALTVGAERTGGTGYQRTIHIDSSKNMSGTYVIVQFTDGTKTSAKVSVVTIPAEGTDITVSYQKAGTKVDVWLVSGMPKLTGGDTEVEVLAYDGTDGN